MRVARDIQHRAPGLEGTEAPDHLCLLVAPRLRSGDRRGSAGSRRRSGQHGAVDGADDTAVRHDGSVRLNPPSQYADDRNLRAPQALWQYQDPYFDLVAWVLEVAGVAPGSRVLDLGCGNGRYVAAMAARGSTPSAVTFAGDAPCRSLADAARQRRRRGTARRRRLVRHRAGAPHAVPRRGPADRRRASSDTVTRPAGRCVVVTNGPGHLQSLRDLVETAVEEGRHAVGDAQPGHPHVLARQRCRRARVGVHDRDVCPPDAAPVALRDADVAADYIASVGDLYQHEIARPWSEVVEEVPRWAPSSPTTACSWSAARPGPSSAPEIMHRVVDSGWCWRVMVVSAMVAGR